MHTRTAHARTGALAGLAALALALSGCSGDAVIARATAAVVPSTAPSVAPSAPAGAPTEQQRASSPAPSPAPSSPAPSSPVPSPAASSPAAPSPAAPSPATPSPVVTDDQPPEPAVDVAAVQRQLQELRYYGGEVDGRSGPATRSAVMAFQKVNGLTADGTVGPRTLAALAAPRPPQLRMSSPADRVEVDLDRQVLHVVEDGEIVRTMPVSSGNGERYGQRGGGTARALTPVGTFRIERRIVGVRNAALGTLYDPQYFHEGWAIHGSNSVPAFPASHGCVRVTRADAKYLLDAIDVGTTVHLYGGQHVFTPGSEAAAPTADR